MNSIVSRQGYLWVSAAGMLPSSLQGRIYGDPQMSLSADLCSSRITLRFVRATGNSFIPD